MPHPQPSVKNRTNIRTITNLLIRRALIRSSFWVAPGRAADRVARLFLAPRRRLIAAPAGFMARGQVGVTRSGDVSRETCLAVETPHGMVAAWCQGHDCNPTGPAALLVHGWEDDHVSLAPLAERLVQTGHRVLTLDLPGHGRSPLPPNRITPLPMLAAAIAALGREAEALQMTPFKAVIAHSLGGTAALLAATEQGLPAERFAILAAPNHSRLFAHTLMAMLGLDARQTAMSFAAIERLTGRSLDSLHLPPKLRQLSAPGLILHSRDDRVVPLQHSRENAATWPRAELRILDGLGHRRLLSDPQVHSMLLRFVGAAAPADTSRPWAIGERP